MTNPREINEDLSDVIARSFLMERIERAAALPCLAGPPPPRQRNPPRVRPAEC